MAYLTLSLTWPECLVGTFEWYQGVGSLDSNPSQYKHRPNISTVTLQLESEWTSGSSDIRKEIFSFWFLTEVINVWDELCTGL